MTLDKFLDVPAFDLDQKAYDTQPTLGPWQSTSDVPWDYGGKPVHQP